MPLIQWIMQNLGGGVPTFQSTGGIVMSGSAIPRLGLVYVPTGGVVIGGNADAIIPSQVEQSIYFQLIINSFYQTRFLLDIGDALPGNLRVRSLRQYAGSNQYLIENDAGDTEWINDSEVPFFEDRHNNIADSRDRIFSTLQRLDSITPAQQTDYSDAVPMLDSVEGFKIFGIRITRSGVRYLVIDHHSRRRELSSGEVEEHASKSGWAAKIATQIRDIASRISRLSQLVVTSNVRGVTYASGDARRLDRPVRAYADAYEKMRLLNRIVPPGDTVRSYEIEFGLVPKDSRQALLGRQRNVAEKLDHLIAIGSVVSQDEPGIESFLVNPESPNLWLDRREMLLEKLQRLDAIISTDRSSGQTIAVGIVPPDREIRLFRLRQHILDELAVLNSAGN